MLILDLIQIWCPDGNKFSIYQIGKLYYVNNVHAEKENMCKHKNIEYYYKVFGHCNVRDVTNLENIVRGMNIPAKQTDFKCPICIEGTMRQFRNHFLTDAKANFHLSLFIPT